MGHAIDGKQNADITGQDLPNQLNDKLPHYSNYQMYKGMGATVRNNKQYEVESINKLPISSHRYQHNQQQQKLNKEQQPTNQPTKQTNKQTNNQTIKQTNQTYRT